MPVTLNPQFQQGTNVLSSAGSPSVRSGYESPFSASINGDNNTGFRSIAQNVNTANTVPPSGVATPLVVPPSRCPPAVSTATASPLKPPHSSPPHKQHSSHMTHLPPPHQTTNDQRSYHHQQHQQHHQQHQQHQHSNPYDQRSYHQQQHSHHSFQPSGSNNGSNNGNAQRMGTPPPRPPPAHTTNSPSTNLGIDPSELVGPLMEAGLLPPAQSSSVSAPAIDRLRSAEASYDHYTRVKKQTEKLKHEQQAIRQAREMEFLRQHKELEGQKMQQAVELAKLESKLRETQQSIDRMKSAQQQSNYALHRLQDERAQCRAREEQTSKELNDQLAYVEQQREIARQRELEEIRRRIRDQTYRQNMLAQEKMQVYSGRKEHNLLRREHECQLKNRETELSLKETQLNKEWEEIERRRQALEAVTGQSPHDPVVRVVPDVGGYPGSGVPIAEKPSSYRFTPPPAATENHGRVPSPQDANSMGMGMAYHSEVSED
eukprot:NODE_72_length_1732_cov_637.868536_g71_i0.p1 GENE.NODE_72_length_1732_cov_637.868536_g71_i0~~NODE_72_length_1732_cov_637.868536_g71_i0.p1  ORF type:complete len:508 (-),score=147.88 NODE_72_length_1732_cov_637.868536_g71_i0:207-1670(-)